MEHDTDDQLVALILRGDVSAMELLTHRYYAKVYAYCARHLGDPIAAQDITQEVFLKLLQSAGSYRPRGKFAGWLMTIAVTCCRTYLSSAYHRHASAFLPVETLRLPAEGTVEENAERASLTDVVRAALLELPAPQRETLLLRFYGGYTLSEISRITGAPLPTVKYRIRQAYKRLKIMLKEDLYEED